MKSVWPTGGKVLDLGGATEAAAISMNGTVVTDSVRMAQAPMALRRKALEQVPFSSGYGVEIGLAIDLYEKFGLGAIAQVDLQERIHHNQPLESLSKMSFAIIQTVMRRIEKRYGIRMLEDVNKTMKLIRYDQQRLLLDVDEIAELERPPMIEVPTYARRRRHTE